MPDLESAPPINPGQPQPLKLRTPGGKLLVAILVALALSIPMLAIYLIVYDRQNQSETAQASIVEGWGGPQTVAGPVLVIPYVGTDTETVEQNGRQVTRTIEVEKELMLSPEVATIDTQIDPAERKRSIYSAVVYETALKGSARFAMPDNLERSGIPVAALQWGRAELRFGLSDASGLFGQPPRVTVNGQALKLEPGHGLGTTSGSGFFTALDAAPLQSAPLQVAFDFRFRGNGAITLAPRAGDTTWNVASGWQSPSFRGDGGFLPTKREVNDKGFTASYRIGNLALGQPLINASDGALPVVAPGSSSYASPETVGGGAGSQGYARIDLVQPVDLYDQVNRATKYGFLFIGFTFLAFLMFDIIGGVRVSAVEYLLVGTGLILFFALLLAFAEVIGFGFAYVIAAGAIIGLITAYSAAVLKSWRRAYTIGGLLTGLYGVLYVLLSLEGYSLLIGSLMLFAALAGVMYATRNLDWGGEKKLA